MRSSPIVAAIAAKVRHVADGAALAAALGLLAAPAAHADETPLAQRNTFGEVGLLEMPSARMAPDGELSFTAAGLSGAQRVTLDFQIFPWMEGSFRYSHVAHWANLTNYYDRSFGLKIRLFEETPLIPEVSIGLRDLVGTGVYGSEFLVASKRFGDFDFTAGLGWGRLASNGTFRNPFAYLIHSFKARAKPTTTGTVDFGQFFHGPDMGVFGGAVWHTPIDNLSLTLEYSSDRYLRETAFGGYRTKWPVNVGLTYSPLSYVQLTGGWFYGNSFGGTFSISFDPTRSAAPQKIGTPPMPVILRAGNDRADAVARLVEEMSGDGPSGGDSRWQPAQNSAALSHASFATLLAGAPGRPENIEFDGRTLLANVHARNDSAKYCQSYAKLAAASRADINLVAVTDLDDSGYRVAMCEVQNSDAHLLQMAAYSGDPQTGDGSPAGLDLAKVKRRIRDDAQAQLVKVEAVSLSRSEMIVYYSNSAYEFEDAAIGRLLRVLMADAPPNIEVFRMISMTFDRPVREIRILRAPMERMYSTRGTTADVPGAISVRGAPMDNPVLDEGMRGAFPRFSWSLSPSVRQGLFDPNAPVRLQIFGSASGSVEFFQGFSLEGTFEANIFNTFNAGVPALSALPHVRSDIAQYLTKGENGIAALDAAYRLRITPDVFVEAKAGYLESMFAGAGAQVLWRPDGQRWSLGADIYQVWRRNFDRRFGLLDYHILTGHASIYYRSPWYGLNFEGHFGRYLAGDYGATFEVTRGFATGVQVGAFATFTNVPFAKFGEGSFDKGIVLRIPLEWALPFSSQSEYNLSLTPLTRDGGQRLLNDDSLYDETKRTSYGELAEHKDSIANP